MGKVGVTLRAWKGRRSVTVRGGSRALRNLSRVRSRNEAFNEAYSGAFSLIPFSPDKVEVLDVEYAYYERAGKA